MMHGDPYDVVVAALAGMAAGMSLVGWAMVRRERERENAARRAERRLRIERDRGGWTA